MPIYLLRLDKSANKCLDSLKIMCSSMDEIIDDKLTTDSPMREHLSHREKNSDRCSVRISSTPCILQKSSNDLLTEFSSRLTLQIKQHLDDGMVFEKPTIGLSQRATRPSVLLAVLIRCEQFASEEKIRSFRAAEMFDKLMIKVVVGHGHANAAARDGSLRLVSLSRSLSDKLNKCFNDGCHGFTLDDAIGKQSN